MPSDTVEILRLAAPSALSALPVEFAYLFGSRADGSHGPHSDIDVAVLLSSTVAEEERLGIASRSADALAAATGLGGIDVTVLDDAPIRFLGRVLRQRVVIYSRDEPRRVAWESLTGRMADDVEVWAAPMDRDLLAAIAEGRR